MLFQCCLFLGSILRCFHILFVMLLLLMVHSTLRLRWFVLHHYSMYLMYIVIVQFLLSQFRLLNNIPMILMLFQCCLFLGSILRCFHILFESRQYRHSHNNQQKQLCMKWTWCQKRNCLLYTQSVYHYYLQTSNHILQQHSFRQRNNILLCIAKFRQPDIYCCLLHPRHYIRHHRFDHIPDLYNMN